MLGFTHLFKANKAYKTTVYVKKVVDSLKQKEVFGTHDVGNQLDAFKHAFWSWKLADVIGSRAAKSLGIAHEKGNKQFYDKGKLEDGFLSDSISSVMDLYNNKMGLIFQKNIKTKPFKGSNH